MSVQQLIQIKDHGVLDANFNLNQIREDVLEKNQLLESQNELLDSAMLV